jgi:hypothetical protein
MSRPARAASGAALVLMSAVGALALAPAASAAPLPKPSVSPATISQFQPFIISGSGCIDPGTGAPGGVGVSGYEFGDGMLASSDGTWSLPTSYGVGPGTYTLNAYCELPGGRQPYPAFSVTVAAPGSGPAPAPAPAPLPPPPPVVAPPPPPAPRPAPPRTAAPSPAPTTAPRATPTPAPPAAPTTTTAAPAPAPVAPGPAVDCTDCARVTPDEPLDAGERLSLSWTGFQPGEQITVVMRSTPVTLGTFTADAAGTVTAALELPDDAEGGAHTLTFSGPLSGDLVVLPFRLAEAEPAEAASAPTTARSDVAGSGDATLGFWAIGGGLAAVLLVAGGVALRGRRSAAATGPAHPVALVVEEPQEPTRAG